MKTLTNEEREAIYRRLRDYGFSASKARAIVIDAQRGDEYALSVCVVVANLRMNSPSDGQKGSA